LNKTCLISDEIAGGNFSKNFKNENSGVISKRGKSLNKTGMVVIDENEDIADIENFYFLNQKPKVQKGKEEKGQHTKQQ
jgi:hypothetical protein